MKKKTLIFVLVFLLASLASIGLAACEKQQPHTHTFSDQWSHDGTHHWYDSTCGHDVIDSKTQHTFGEWIIIKPATQSENGRQKRECSVCGFGIIEEIPSAQHTHTYSETWSFDETYHWHDATCGHEATSQKSQHQLNGDECEVCDYADFSKLYDFEELLEDGEVVGYSIIATEFAKSKSQLMIPQSYNGRPVLAISNEGMQDISAKTLSVPFGITTIGDYVFKGSALERIEIPDSVTQLGAAFYQCEYLREVVIGDGAQSIVKNAFRETPALKSVVIGKSVESIGDYAFYLSGIEAITIPDNVKEIGSASFYQTEKLKSIDLGKGLKIIGKSAFSKSALEEVVIPDSVVEMWHAFYQSDKIKKVVIGNGVESIVDYTFRDTPALESVIIGNSVKSFGNYVFHNSNLKSIELPDSVENFGQTFRGAANLTSVKIGRGVKALPLRLFDGCTSLKNVELGPNVESIADFAFADCSALNEINLESVKTIGGFAFQRCKHLYSVTFGENLTSIASGAFSESNRLIEVCNKSSLEIDYKKASIYHAKNNCNSESGKGAFLTTQDGYVFYSYLDGSQRKTFLMDYEGDKAQLTLPSPQSIKFNSQNIENYDINVLAFGGNNTITDVVIPDGVNVIYNAAFKNCTELKNVTFGKDVTTIKTRAFENSGIITLTVPEAVTSIEIYAFLECASLKRIEWNAIDCAALDYNDINVNKGIFKDAEKDASIKSVDTIVFGDKVQKIPAFTFRYMENVTSLYIPASVRVLEHSAFHKCGLTSVTFAVTTGWSVTDPNWGSDVTKYPNFSDSEEIISWLCGNYTSHTTWTR